MSFEEGTERNGMLGRELVEDDRVWRAMARSCWRPGAVREVLSRRSLQAPALEVSCADALDTGIVSRR